MNSANDQVDLFEDEPSGFARWIVPALIISILLHVILFMWARGLSFQFFNDDATADAIPPAIKVELVKVDPKLPDPEFAEEVRKPAVPTAVELPTEKVTTGSMEAEIKTNPAVPEIQNPLLGDKPKVDASSFQEAVKSAEQNGAKSVVNDPDSDLSELIVPEPEVSGRPLLELANPDNKGGGAPDSVGPVAGGTTPGFSNLDTLLAQTGPLTPETAPIRMDSDVLYAYDSDVLQPQAVESLSKLGEIIRKNPQLIFAIEGHSDSDGNAEYNQSLSERRAEAVRNWLVQIMQIDPTHVTTRGYGNTRLIVPATHPYDENAEAPNRRVEIVLHDRPLEPR